MSDSSLKEKTVRGIGWSFFGTFINQGVQFVVGIILARLLLPEEFGLIGMIFVFIAISNTIINCGFSQALIQRKYVTQVDYSTVFYFNIVVSVFLYIIVFVSAGLVARFFSEPQIIPLLRILSLSFIVNSFSLIQQTILIKEIDFKILTKIQIIASVFSGVGAIFLAFSGFGVWSLVLKNIVLNGAQSALLWYYSRWLPKLQFNIASFKTLFSFGSKLLASGLIDTLYLNIYYIIIGRHFSATDLGFYIRANQFKNMASQNIIYTIQRVTYPALSSVQDDTEQLKRGYRKSIQSTMFIIFPLLFGIVAIAEPLILLLIGERWMQSVSYLQLLCFVGMLYPLQAINLNMLNVKGRSDLSLRLEIIKKLMIVPIIIIAIRWGIVGLIIGLIIQSILDYFVSSFYSSKLIGYSTRDQLRDIAPGFLIAACMGISTFISGQYMPDIHAVKLILQILIAISLYYTLSRIWNGEMLDYFNEIVRPFIKKLKVVMAK